MSFEHFVETLEHVPPELERNFTLLQDLDKRTSEVMKEIDACVKEYRALKSRSARDEMKKKSSELFEKLSSYSDDKIELASQTYELIDKNIRRLTNLGTVQANNEDPNGTITTPAIGFDMPLDPHEPRYCVCHGVSHGDMIACDNKECHIEWFHYACVGLKTAPKGKWYCGQCFNISANKKKSRSLRRAY